MQDYNNRLGKKGKGVHEQKAQTAGAYPGFISMKHAQEDEMPVHRKVMSPVPIYTPG